MCLCCSQEGRELEKDFSNLDMTRKLTRLSIEDSSLADWHLGFHISLVCFRDVSFYLIFICVLAAVWSKDNYFAGP